MVSICSELDRIPATVKLGTSLSDPLKIMTFSP